MSAHLNWLIIRNNNAYLWKNRNIKKPFSKEPNNLLNLASFRYNGLVHCKSVGIEAPADNKGFTLVTKKAKAVYKPAKFTVKRTFKKSGPRRTLYILRRMLLVNKYRTDLTKAALRRASAILKSQKRTVPVKKARTKKTE
uniref:Large ribosomal subunit protein eL28 n=1 Tax=Clastoptera arizonana TaxID=38151 RepID=A0A1B6D9L3_9HEMI